MQIRKLPRYLLPNLTTTHADTCTASNAYLIHQSLRDFSSLFHRQQTNVVLVIRCQSFENRHNVIQKQVAFHHSGEVANVGRYGAPDHGRICVLRQDVKLAKTIAEQAGTMKLNIRTHTKGAQRTTRVCTGGRKNDFRVANSTIKPRPCIRCLSHQSPQPSVFKKHRCPLLCWRKTKLPHAPRRHHVNP